MALLAWRERLGFNSHTKNQPWDGALQYEHNDLVLYLHYELFIYLA